MNTTTEQNMILEHVKITSGAKPGLPLAKCFLFSPELNFSVKQEDYVLGLLLANKFILDTGKENVLTEKGFEFFKGQK